MFSHKTKIVLVDDEEDLCFVLSQMLQSHGFEVHSFYTLEEGMQAILNLKPEWVIMDNDLPDGRGWEKTGSIRETLPDVNVINISANPDSSGESEPKVHYLVKPIHVNSIVELINNHPA